MVAELGGYPTPSLQPPAAMAGTAADPVWAANAHSGLLLDAAINDMVSEVAQAEQTPTPVDQQTLNSLQARTHTAVNRAIRFSVSLFSWVKGK